MNITMVGAGAVGVYFGGRLLENGCNVTFLVREHRKALIEKEGLVIYSDAGQYTLKEYQVATTSQEISDCDLVIVAVKGYHLQQLMPVLQEFAQRGVKILPLLNGMEHIYGLKENCGEEAVLGGVAYIIATLDEKGHVHHSGSQHSLVVGPLHPSQQQLCQQLAKATEGSKFIFKYSEAIEQALWHKYIFITAFSSITTACDAPIGVLRHNEATASLISNVLLEMKQLALALHAPIDDDIVEKTLKTIEALHDEATSSMHQDRRKGLPLEVDHLQGGALRLAKSCNLPLPHLATLYAVLSMIAVVK
ncbi:2-dehydropantoate 2-reductase [Fictibacillus macauensis ZFHKF-1]|uniref:2-dehydropantoate 2-reductase n=1 Tax=Fictibacillus macauensis ZFHKF-1 TaxID=1196324 RepID=I8UA92_9BACL|nr:ketopantoate reductase family protein [Fictibacillus macauensis]EIT83723.1 2-dehydropantoate 2-reductase [Fictibacillus macauensis ZFHKF-1]